MQLTARQFRFTFPRPALVMGIVNVTPDSFSDGGRFLDLEAAVAHALRLVADGADILDIGGESTRPGATPVGLDEELRRVMPVIERLSGQVGVPISIDTMKPEVADRAVAAGASIINDVAANRSDESMWELAARSGAAYVCMHMKGDPRTMQQSPAYADVVGEVGAFFRDRLERLQRCGLRVEQVILDPGIGFGKTVEHNLELIARVGEFARLERPVLVGASRKSFIGKTLGLHPAVMVSGSVACACAAVGAGALLVRVHDVAETVQALRMTEAISAKAVGETAPNVGIHS